MKNKFKRTLAVIATATMCSNMILASTHVDPGNKWIIPAEAASRVMINENNFPDEIFRNYVSRYCDSDSDGILTSLSSSICTVLITSLQLSI